MTRGAQRQAGAAASWSRTQEHACGALMSGAGGDTLSACADAVCDGGTCICSAGAHVRGGRRVLVDGDRWTIGCEACARQLRTDAADGPRCCRHGAERRRSGVGETGRSRVRAGAGDGQWAGEVERLRARSMGERGGAAQCRSCGSGDRVETVMPGGASGRGAGVGRGCGAGVPGALSGGRPPLAPLVGRRCAGSRRGASWAACGCAGGMQQRVA